MFLSLTGTYRRSKWLGLPLNCIATHPGPPSTGIPRPLFRLIEHLSSAEALATAGLFVDSIKVVLQVSPSGGGGGTPTGGALQVGYGVRRSTQRALLQSLSGLVEIFEGDPDSPLPKVRPINPL